MGCRLTCVPAWHPSCDGAVQADKDVILGAQIGRGGYGKVYHSKYRDQNVAVKVSPRTPSTLEQCQAWPSCRTHQVTAVKGAPLHLRPVMLVLAQSPPP